MIPTWEWSPTYAPLYVNTVIHWSINMLELNHASQTWNSKKHSKIFCNSSEQTGREQANQMNHPLQNNLLQKRRRASKICLFLSMANRGKTKNSKRKKYFQSLISKDVFPYWCIRDSFIFFLFLWNRRILSQPDSQSLMISMEVVEHI